MDAFFVTFIAVAISEVGDKTQFLALFLAACFRKPAVIIVGIVLALLANHTLAGLAGLWVRDAVTPNSLRIALGLCFLLLAVWTLKTDTMSIAMKAADRYGALGVTFVTYFLAEFGDKTQIATIGLAAQYGALIPVVVASVLGVLVIDVPAILIGKAVGQRVPSHLARYISAGLFALFGVVALIGGAVRI